MVWFSYEEERKRDLEPGTSKGEVEKGDGSYGEEDRGGWRLRGNGSGWDEALGAIAENERRVVGGAMMDWIG
jgi:hypothetical protein